ncbi:hypothetical protein INR49_018024 [Caranx melampygus]|nr:hypothetical protein INR49_018024 [Caranx melampygus]
MATPQCDRIMIEFVAESAAKCEIQATSASHTHATGTLCVMLSKHYSMLFKPSRHQEVFSSSHVIETTACVYGGFQSPEHCELFVEYDLPSSVTGTKIKTIYL